MKKLVSLLTTVAMAASMTFSVAQAAEEDYSRIGFGNSQFGDLKSVYSKDETADFSDSILALDADGEDVFFEDHEDLVFSSSNENVVTISADGTLKMRDYGVATVSAKYGDLSTSMLITVTPKVLSTHKDGDKEKEEKETPIARTGGKAIVYTVEKLSNAKRDSDATIIEGQYVASTKSVHWPYPEPKKSNFILEAWFYDDGVNETGIGFKKNEDGSNTGAIGALKPGDKTYRISGVNTRWDHIWQNKHELDSGSTDTKIARTKGWHQVTIVQAHPDGNFIKSDKARSTLSWIYLDGQLIKTETSEYKTRWQTYGYAGFTIGNTVYFDDGANVEYMQLRGVTLGADETDAEKLVANVDYLGYSGANATIDYQWYYADSKDAAEWTAIEGATEKGYKPENLPAGSFIKVGAKLTETINGTGSYTTEEYFSDPTFIFDGTYESISLGKSASYTTKGGTIALTVTGFAKDGMERVISDRADMTFSSNDEKIATVSANGTVTAVDYGVAKITVNYGELSASMLITVTPKTISTMSADKEVGAPVGRTNDKAVVLTVGDLSLAKNSSTAATIAGQYVAATTTFHWPAIPKKSNMVAEGWFYDNGETVDSEAAIGFRRYNDYSNVGAVGVLKSADTTYRISGADGRWDHIWQNKHELDSGSTDTKIARTKGWHQVTIVHGRADGNYTAKAQQGNDTVAYSTVYSIYLDGQLIKSSSSNHTTTFQVYGYAGFTKGHTAYYDDGVNLEYMAVNGVVLTADETDAEKLVANVDYLGYSGTNATVAYQWYYAASEDATVWTKIDGATEKSYKAENLPAGSFVKAGAKVTETINGAGTYTTNEYFSDPTFLFDGTYETISLGKSSSYTTKGNTIALKVTGFSKDGMERVIEDHSEMTFVSSDEQTATVSADGTVTAVDYGRTTITVNYGEMSASMLITVTPGKITTQDTSKETASAISRTGDKAVVLTVGDLSLAKNESNATAIEGEYVAATTTFHWPAMPNKSNMIAEGWFYDNGETENAESAIGFRRYNDYSNTGAIGVIRSADTTYKISSIGQRWDQVWAKHIKDSAVTDTKIARTKGWHQVTIVQGNTNGQVTGKANVGPDTVAKSDMYEIYLDGQLIKTESGEHTTRYQVYGYAGFTRDTVAYFDDGLNAYYVGIDDVEITKEDKALKASYNYYGPLSNSTVSYQWYSKQNGEWTAIDGANAVNFTPSDDMKDSAFKVVVTVTDTVNGTAITTDRESKEYFDVETSVSYADGKVIVKAAEEINGVLVIAEYKTVNGYKTLKSVRIIEDIIASEGDVKEIETGVISGTIMLWESIKTQVPCCDAYEIK